jgi:hypothetical protein
VVLLLFQAALCQAAADPSNSRPPRDADDLQFWLENMVAYHRFTRAEVAAATGLADDEIAAALERLDIRPGQRPARAPEAPLVVLPYPGGRHPRIGFLDGAVDPQRETKFSVFTPWDADSYVVCDVPEAVWSNLGLTYLAHTHVETLWTKAGLELEKLEWTRGEAGELQIERRLPNGIAFGARVEPTPGDVRMELWLTNGTREPLSDLRVQNCVMLKGAAGFTEQTNDNKVFRAPYAAARAADAPRWVIVGFAPIHRAWGNAPCPCLHADPQFPDCPPGETVRVTGRLWFYEGDDLEAELARLDATGWAGNAE